MTSIDRKTQGFGEYYYEYDLCIIQEKRSDQEKSK